MSDRGVEVTVGEHGVAIREHERRLNMINGSLERLADSVDQLIVQQATWQASVTSTWRATARTWGIVFGVALGIASPVISALVVYALLHT